MARRHKAYSPCNGEAGESIKSCPNTRAANVPESERRRTSIYSDSVGKCIRLSRGRKLRRARKPRERKKPGSGGTRVNIENKKRRVGRSGQRKEKREIDTGAGEKQRSRS